MPMTARGTRTAPGTDTWVFGLSSALTIAAAMSAGSAGRLADTGLVPLIVYFASGKLFVRGIAAGAVKG